MYEFDFSSYFGKKENKSITMIQRNTAQQLSLYINMDRIKRQKMKKMPETSWKPA